jgi:hypothetical protein
MRQWQGIILHHSATKDSGTVSWDAIKKYHTETQGWSDIGYHCGFEYVGDKVVFQPGRSLDKDAAACVGKNSTHIQVCMVGDFDAVEPTHEMYIAVAHLCKRFMSIYDFGIDAIRGHFAYAPKTCPGKLFNWLTLAQYILTEEV